SHLQAFCRPCRLPSEHSRRCPRLEIISWHRATMSSGRRNQGGFAMNDACKRWVHSRAIRRARSALTVLALALLCAPPSVHAQTLKKVPVPFSPVGINSLPLFVAREARLYEKNGIDVDVIFIGASSALFQAMLSGAADIAGSGGPAVISNVLKGGDIIQVAA